ncbi:MAG: futalosine hydrolase [Thermoleophilia bacterium]|nr:futalosine hydrolase [Thermoleophilia bacterium]
MNGLDGQPPAFPPAGGPESGGPPPPVCLRPDAGELHVLVEDVELALLVATTVEAGDLLDAMEAADCLEVATKRWWVGNLRAGGRRVRAALVVSGYDRVNAAHALTCLLAAGSPRLVLQVGVAGAFAATGLEVRDVVLASEEIYGDTGVLTPDGWESTATLRLPLASVAGTDYWNTFRLDPGLVRRAAEVIEAASWPEPPPRVAVGPCVTVSQVTGVQAEGDRLATLWGALAESMEGAAAAHMCALYSVPFLEVRAVSNLVVDRDRAAWDIPGAAARAARAALAVCARLDEVLVAWQGAGVPGEGIEP